MAVTDSTTDIDVIAELASAQEAVGSAERALLEVVAECDRSELWRPDGARDLPQWLSARLGVSNWKARRMVDAAHALSCLPHTSQALTDGTLPLDKVLELTRFATPETEKKLVTWARRVSPAAIRRKGDVATRASLEDTKDIERSRYLRWWWFDDGARLGLEGELPAEQGAVVAKALDRMAGRLPDIASDDDAEAEASSFTESLDARRADALVALASQRIASDSDPDRATMVVHAELAALIDDDRGCGIEGGGVVHPETARRLCCDSRLQVVLTDPDGNALGIGRTSRTVPPYLMRQVRMRDGGCTFPGCEARWFLYAHHIQHWVRGGPTDLENLLLVCGFHHKLVHEFGWNVSLTGTVVEWFRPSGRPLDRAPPERRLAGVA